MSLPTLDRQQLIQIGIGFAAGIGIIVFFVVLGLSIGLTASIDLGVPPQ